MTDNDSTWTEVASSTTRSPAPTESQGSISTRDCRRNRLIHDRGIWQEQVKFLARQVQEWKYINCLAEDAQVTSTKVQAGLQAVLSYVICGFYDSGSKSDVNSTPIAEPSEMGRVLSAPLEDAKEPLEEDTKTSELIKEGQVGTKDDTDEPRGLEGEVAAESCCDSLTMCSQQLFSHDSAHV